MAGAGEPAKDRGGFVPRAADGVVPLVSSAQLVRLDVDQPAEKLRVKQLERISWIDGKSRRGKPDFSGRNLAQLLNGSSRAVEGHRGFEFLPETGMRGGGNIAPGPWERPSCLRTGSRRGPKQAIQRGATPP